MPNHRPRGREGPALRFRSRPGVNVSLNWQGLCPEAGKQYQRRITVPVRIHGLPPHATNACVVIERGRAADHRPSFVGSDWTVGREQPPSRSFAYGVADDDWRLRIELDEDAAGGLFGGCLCPGRMRGTSSGRSNDRLAVSRDGRTVFVYAGLGRAARPCPAR